MGFPHLCILNIVCVLLFFWAEWDRSSLCKSDFQGMHFCGNPGVAGKRINPMKYILHSTWPQNDSFSLYSLTNYHPNPHKTPEHLLLCPGLSEYWNLSVPKECQCRWLIYRCPFHFGSFLHIDTWGRWQRSRPTGKTETGAGKTETGAGKTETGAGKTEAKPEPSGVIRPRFVQKTKPIVPV